MFWKKLIHFLSLLAVISGYELGVTHKYNYETVTTVDEECLGENDPGFIGQKFNSKIHLTAIWQNQQNPTQQLIKIEILDTKLLVSKKNNLVEHPSELNKLSVKPTFLLREKGTVVKVWEDPEENSAIRNIKKGISSLFQTGNKNQEVREVSVAGDCQTIYEVKAEHIRKRGANCIHSQYDKSLSQPHGVRSASTQHLSTSDCKLLDTKSEVVSQCTVNEYVKTFSNLWIKASICVNAKSELLFEGVNNGHKVFSNKDLQSVIEELKKEMGGKLDQGNIEAVLNSQDENVKGNVVDHLKKYQDSLKNENLAKMKSSIAFYKLLPSFRSATKEDIIKILQDKKLKAIQGQVLDLIAASLKETPVQAAFEYFKDVTEYDEIVERFLISLSVSPRVKDFILQEMKLFVESKKRNEKIEATAVSALGSLLKLYSLKRDATNDKVIDEHRTYLERKLTECSQPQCVQSYLLALRNAADPRSLPLLLQHTLKGGKSALDAILAVRNIDVRFIPVEAHRKLLNVFLQVGGKQDRSTRSTAADILLDLHPDNEILKGILTSLSDQSDPEFATFLASKIAYKTSLNEELRLRIVQLLSEKYISHYYSLSQKGSSSLFTRPLLSSAGINVTYGIEMEMLPGNLMKRSVFDVNFKTPEISNLLTVGMFAEGIASLAGGGGSSEENASPQAGMELTVLGSSLRPYIFFTGTSELMGHAWSGTASTPTPALQGIYPFSDDERVVVLHNGLVAVLQLRGVLSTDLSASIQISLWSQNAQSQVKNAGALLMRGAVTIDTGFSTIQGAFQLSGQSAIDFSTNLVFSESPFQMCLQMEHPNIVVKHDAHRSVSVAGSKYSLRRTKRRKREIASKSYALHSRNNEQCRYLN